MGNKNPTGFMLSFLLIEFLAQVRSPVRRDSFFSASILANVANASWSCGDICSKSQKLLGDGSRCRRFNLASEQIVDGDGKGIYKGRQKGTTKASPCRARLLRMRGLTVAEIATALGTNKRTVQRYLKASHRQSCCKTKNSEIRLKKAWTSVGPGLPIATTGGSFFLGLQTCLTNSAIL